MAEPMDGHKTTAPLLDAVFPKLLGETTQQDRPEVVGLVRDWVRDAPPASAAFAQRAMAARPDSFDTLRSMQVPAVVVVGAEDVLTPPTEANEMVGVLADGELTTLDGVGHLSPVEAPTEVADVLEGLMRRVGG